VRPVFLSQIWRKNPKWLPKQEKSFLCPQLAKFQGIFKLSFVLNLYYYLQNGGFVQDGVS
jgi:hypothetical protein